MLFQYDNIEESVATDLQKQQISSEQLSNTKGSSDSINQLRPTLVTHRPSQSQTKKLRESVPYRVTNEYIDNP